MQSVNKKSEVKSDNGKNESVETMLDFNALQYDMYPDLSVVVDRTTKTTYPLKSTFELGSTLQCYFNTGSDFIDASESYFVFDLKMVAGNNNGRDLSTINTAIGPVTDKVKVFTWGDSGSAFNLIEEILITDRAGNEIERIRDVNRLANILLRYNRTSDYKSTTGSSVFYPLNERKYNSVVGVGDAGITRWCLPLKHMSGLFDYNQLIPSQLMSGLRIELKFATITTAFVAPTDDANGASSTVTPIITIENPRFMMDSVKLTDSIMRELNKRSAEHGLEIMYRSWYRDFAPTPNASINFESRKAVSRAFGAIAQFVKIPATQTALETTDLFASDVFDLTEWQWRAGNLYFPNQKLEGPVSQLGVETFVHAQKFFGKHKHQQYDNSIDVNDFIAEENSSITNHSRLGVVTVDLERTTVQDLSGIPLNNSRVLAFTGKYANTDSTKGVYVFLNYLKVARVFMENTEVEE